MEDKRYYVYNPYTKTTICGECVFDFHDSCYKNTKCECRCQFDRKKVEEKWY